MMINPQFRSPFQIVLAGVPSGTFLRLTWFMLRLHLEVYMWRYILVHIIFLSKGVKSRRTVKLFCYVVSLWTFIYTFPDSTIAFLWFITTRWSVQNVKTTSGEILLGFEFIMPCEKRLSFITVLSVFAGPRLQDFSSRCDFSSINSYFR